MGFFALLAMFQDKIGAGLPLFVVIELDLKKESSIGVTNWTARPGYLVYGSAMKVFVIVGCTKEFLILIPLRLLLAALDDIVRFHLEDIGKVRAKRQFQHKRDFLPAVVDDFKFFASRIHLTNPEIKTEGGVIGAHALGVTLNRTVSEGIHEEFEIINYSGKKVTFVLELALRSDFADIFEVKAHDIIQRGKQQTQWDENKKLLCTTYDNKDFHRAAI